MTNPRPSPASGQVPNAASAHDEIVTLLAEHAPHLVASWRMTKQLHSNPSYLRGLADSYEMSEPRGPALSVHDVFARHRNPSRADRIATADRLKAEGERLTAQADKIMREVGAE